MQRSGSAETQTDLARTGLARYRPLLSQWRRWRTGRVARLASGPTSSGPTSSGPTSSGPTSSGPTSSGPTSSGPTSSPGGGSVGSGVILLGRVWAGGASQPFDGAVIIDGAGRITYLGAANDHVIGSDLPTLGGPHAWIGPGICDAHVHVPMGSDVLPTLIRGGVIGVRDLGSSQRHAASIRTARSTRTDHHRLRRHRGERTGAMPFVAASGPMFTAPGGFRSHAQALDWASEYVHSIGQARQLVRRYAVEGADVIKVALDRGGQAMPVLSPAVLTAIVDAAHSAGLPVVAHALRADMVTRAVDAGVDELAHTPTQRLSEELVDRIAAAGISVVSTLQTFFSVGRGRDAAANAAAFYRSGVRMRYGTDFGLAPTAVVGVDPRELDRLADTGLGRLGALRCATEYSAQAPGMRIRSGLLRVGSPAALVVLAADPIIEPGAWRSPLAVLADARLIEN